MNKNIYLKKLDKQQLEFEIKLKHLSSEFKHHLQLLSDEKRYNYSKYQYCSI